MTDSTAVTSTQANNVDESTTPFDPDKYSLEELIKLINAERLDSLQNKTHSEFLTLKERQNHVKELHDILKAINAATSPEGVLNIEGNPDLKAKLERARELGVDIAEGKLSFNNQERDRMVENFRMSIEDLNVQNDMQLQTISRLTNERYETYQMARLIIKPLDEAKKSHARAARGA